MTPQEAKEKYWWAIDNIFNKGSGEAVDRMMKEDYFTRWNGSRGRDNVKGIAKSLLETFPDLEYSIEAIATEGDLVFAHLRLKGTDRGGFMGRPPTGRRMDMTELHMVRFDPADGRYVEGWPCFDGLELSRQLWGK